MSLTAEVLVVVVVVGCVQGSWSQISTFSCYSHCLPLTKNASKGVIRIIFKNLCYDTDYACFAKTVSPAPVFVRIPGTRLRLVPGFRDPGSVLILGQVTQSGNPYLICITFLQIKHHVSVHMNAAFSNNPSVVYLFTQPITVQGTIDEQVISSCKTIKLGAHFQIGGKSSIVYWVFCLNLWMVVIILHVFKVHTLTKIANICFSWCWNKFVNLW